MVELLTVTNPFPHLTDLPDLTPDAVSAFGAKYIARRLMSGGPITQPDYFFALHPDTDFLNQLAQGSSSNDAVRILSPIPQFVVEDEVRDFAVVVRDILSGKLPLPLVYKPNYSAFGNGVFFLTGDPQQDITITISGMLNINRCRLVDMGFSPTEGRLLQKILRRDENREEFLLNLWRFISIRWEEEGRKKFPKQDPGMMETMVDAFRVNGGSYETRHDIVGNPAEGYAFLNKSSWFCTVGQSSFFARATRLSQSEQDAYFDPLYANYTIIGGSDVLFFDDARKCQFEEEIDRLLLSSFQYFSERLLAAGIRLRREVKASFDFMWLPQPGDFPKPLLVEVTL